MPARPPGNFPGRAHIRTAHSGGGCQARCTVARCTVAQRVQDSRSGPYDGNTTAFGAERVRAAAAGGFPAVRGTFPPRVRHAASPEHRNAPIEPLAQRARGLPDRSAATLTKGTTDVWTCRRLRRGDRRDALCRHQRAHADIRGQTLRCAGRSVVAGTSPRKWPVDTRSRDGNHTLRGVTVLRAPSPSAGASPEV